MRALGLSALVIAGCSGAELERVEADRDLLEARVLDLEEEVATLESENKRLKAALGEARSESERERERAKRVAETYEKMGITEDTRLSAVIHTGLGDITCDLWPDIAPVTVLNFVGLSEGTREWKDPKTGSTRTDALYAGTVFHRVIKDFMIQGGDPLGTGRGGPGYRFEDEVYPDVRFDEPGLLAMANAGPGTNGSQFFITDSTPGHLNGKHTIFGKCDLEVVRKIIAEPMEEGPRGPSSNPVDPVVIKDIEIRRD